MIHGEGIVLRLLGQGGDGVLPRASSAWSRTSTGRSSELIQLPHGIILVTGPTGSGKTTTLYSSLLEIRDDETKIITTEDPVEYQLAGINQIQVHPKIGLTFAHSLRSILRHDPDIMLIGEIRDLETAENAIQASLTGHLVFSTLHTNDAAGAYTRLIDMGVEPFLVSSTRRGGDGPASGAHALPGAASSRTGRRRRICPTTFPWTKLEPPAASSIVRSDAASAGRWATGGGWACSNCWSPRSDPRACPRPREHLGDQAGRRSPRGCARSARTAG